MSVDMYQENILDHYENPYHRGALENPTLDYRDLNPLCGDEIRVQARVDHNGCVVEAYFDGAGCVISLAASMLMEEVEGKTLAEIQAMERQDMLDLLGISLTTMRVKCAMLALRTLEKSIHLCESIPTAPPRRLGFRMGAVLSLLRRLRETQLTTIKSVRFREVAVRLAIGVPTYQFSVRLLHSPHVRPGGYTAVGVQELCAHAGVHKGSFYHFFPSKQALAIAVIEAHAQDLQAALT